MKKREPLKAKPDIGTPPSVNKPTDEVQKKEDPSISQNSSTLLYKPNLADYVDVSDLGISPKTFTKNLEKNYAAYEKAQQEKGIITGKISPKFAKALHWKHVDGKDYIFAPSLDAIYYKGFTKAYVEKIREAMIKKPHQPHQPHPK